MILESLRIALRHFRRRPMRSLLVLQGITWGVGLAVFFPALIDGSRQNALEKASELGVDRVVIEADPTGRRMTLEDYEAVRVALGDEIRAIAAARLVGAQISRDGNAGETDPFLFAETTSDFPASRSYAVAKGQFPSTPPSASGALPAAIDPSLAEELFGDVSAIGETLRLRLWNHEEDTDEATGPWRTIEIVGEMSRRTKEALGINDLGLETDHELAGMAKDLLRSIGIISDDSDWKQTDRILYLPMGALAGADAPIDEIEFRADPLEIDRLSEKAQLVLADRGVVPLAITNLSFRTIMSSEIDRYEILNVALFTTVLIMGAFMIANITLFTVMERFREVAIRRVEGATRRDIVLQFLFEGLFLCLIGGLLGVPLGLLLAKGRAWLDPGTLMTVRLPLGRAALAVGLATLSGVLATILPALRASRIEPVEALRHE
ncbi:MAG: ABC transporter permease [Planctomycetota bacterium]